MPPEIELLLFDLGGVLYGIDVARSVQAFQMLLPAGCQFPDATQILGHPIFRQFEMGQLSSAEFRQGLRKTFGLRGSDADLDAAWNALLLGPLAGRAELLARLKGDYRLALLSNTNAMHYEFLAPQSESILQWFDHIYLSHEMGLRKPDPAIYQTVLKREGISAQKVFFIEDSQSNLTAAQALGIEGLLIPTNAPKIELLES